MPLKIIPVDETPTRSYKKGSIYDDVIDQFLAANVAKARIEMTKKDGSILEGNYLGGRLQKRLKERREFGTDEQKKGLFDSEGEWLVARVINGDPYLIYNEPKTKKK